MDYLEWELERQRRALRALLGGGNRDGEALRADGTKGRLAASGGGEADPPAGGEAGPSAGRAAPPAGRSALRRNGTGRPEGESDEPGPPESTRERVLTGEGDALGQAGRDEPEKQAPETPAAPPREGTGPQAALPKASGGETAARETAMEAAERAGTRRDGASGGGTAAGAAADAYTAVYRPARRLPPWAPETGEGGTGSLYGGFSAAGAAEEDSARALSRAVQRDARRYDGGFTIY